MAQPAETTGQTQKIDLAKLEQGVNGLLHWTENCLGSVVIEVRGEDDLFIIYACNRTGFNEAWLFASTDPVKVHRVYRNVCNAVCPGGRSGTI